MSRKPREQFFHRRWSLGYLNMSRVVRKPTVYVCICENKDADQLRDNREADQRLCFRYMDTIIPLLAKSKFHASSHLLWPYSLVCVGPGRKPRRPVFSHRGSYYLHTKGEDSTELDTTNKQQIETKKYRLA